MNSLFLKFQFGAQKRRKLAVFQRISDTDALQTGRNIPVNRSKVCKNREFVRQTRSAQPAPATIFRITTSGAKVAEIFQRHRGVILGS
jgi:hypothetical protein